MLIKDRREEDGTPLIHVLNIRINVRLIINKLGSARYDSLCVVSFLFISGMFTIEKK